MLFVVFGMAIGVMVNGKTIQGSCGGLNNIDGIKRVCDCEDPCEAKLAKLKDAEPKARPEEAVITFRK